MRRPPHKVHVDTFPFLAVLLAAMGSLILLLFIIDRRGKIAARHKAHELAQLADKSRAEKIAQLEARQKAEWDKEHDAIQRQLLQQSADLKSKKDALDADRMKTVLSISMFRAQQQTLESEIARTGQELERERALLAARQSLLQDKLAKGDLTQRLELAKLTDDLLKLESWAKELRNHKSAEPEVYSLVPYQGKRGDRRKPMYVECVDEGLIFHPEKSLLQRETLSVENIRDEVERRGLQRGGKSRAELYVLFLIRPDGVKSYGLARSSLTIYGVDFGYELVEADWVFDFSSEDSAKESFAKNGKPPLAFLPATAQAGSPKVGAITMTPKVSSGMKTPGSSSGTPGALGQFASSPLPAPGPWRPAAPGAFPGMGLPMTGTPGGFPSGATGQPGSGTPGSFAPNQSVGTVGSGMSGPFAPNPSRQGTLGIPGQPMQGEPGQPGQFSSNKPFNPGQPMQGTPGQLIPNQPGATGQFGQGTGQFTSNKPFIASQPGQGTPGQQGQGTPGQPGQGTLGQPGQGTPGQPGQGTPGQPGQGTPGQPGPGTPGPFTLNQP